MLQARTNINGNTESDFADAYMALKEAQDTVKRAEKVLIENVLHGRNYQHKESPDDALIKDKRRIHAALRGAWGELGVIASEIEDALENA